MNRVNIDLLVASCNRKNKKTSPWINQWRHYIVAN